MTSMHTVFRILFALVVTLPLTHPISPVHACSTVLLRREGVLLVGHNLDETTDLKGFVYINKRDYFKIGSTWPALRTYSKDLPCTLNWISRYGSDTWSSIGRDLPDAGMNEAGLVIEEMSLAQHQYPLPVIRPRLFQMQWIQYHLDSFSTVEQVIESASIIYPDGWPWHFFIADKNGHCATLEYIDNKLVVHTGNTLPVTALCNSTYEEELQALKTYTEFGGTQAIDLNNKDIPRFVRAAHMLEAYVPGIHSSPVDYVFKILDNLGGRYTRRSYVVDMVNKTAYFRTGSNSVIRQFSLESFDFSCNTPVQVLDMDAHDSGDVTGLFEEYTFQINRLIAENWINHVIEMVPDATEKERVEGGFSSVQINRYARYPELSLAKTDLHTTRNEYALTALHWAAYQGDLSQVRDLLQQGADVNARTATGTTPLIHAAQAGNLDVVQYLMDHGAEIDLADAHGNTPLITAVAFGQLDIAASLLQAGTNINLTNGADLAPLHYAAANGDISLLKYLLSKEVQLKASSESNLTALMIAVTQGKLKAVKFLLAEGEDPNALDNKGNNALLIALKFKHTEVAEALMKAGVDVAIQNEQGETPWEVAVANRDRKIMALLKEAGVKPPSYGIPFALAGLAVSAVSLYVVRMRLKKRVAN